MRITTFDLDRVAEECGIEIPLRRLVESPGMMTALYWQKLLELVEFLQARGSGPVLFGFLFPDALHLNQPSPPDPVRNWQVKRFVEKWRAEHPDDAEYARTLREEISKRYPLEPSTSVSIWPDWRDRSPLQDGLPVIYYRLQVKHPGKTLSEDLQIQEFADVEQAILGAFG